MAPFLAGVLGCALALPDKGPQPNTDTPYTNPNYVWCMSSMTTTGAHSFGGSSPDRQMKVPPECTFITA